MIFAFINAVCTVIHNPFLCLCPVFECFEYYAHVIIIRMVFHC